MIEWGSLPDWLQLGGVLIAVTAYIAGRRDARRSQAARVHAMVTGYGRSTNPAAHTYTRVSVVNGSEFPIFEVGVALYQPGTRRRFWRLRKRDDRWTGERVEGQHVPTLRAHKTAELEFPGLAPGISRPTTPPVIAVFRDGQGRDWIRWPDGRLMGRKLSRQGAGWGA